MDRLERMKQGYSRVYDDILALNLFETHANGEIWELLDAIKHLYKRRSGRKQGFCMRTATQTGCLRRGECAIEVDERPEVGTRARKEVMHKSVERR
jgi:hypothetical protein